MHWGIETRRSFNIQLSIKYMARLLVIRCKLVYHSSNNDSARPSRRHCINYTWVQTVGASLFENPRQHHNCDMPYVAKMVLGNQTHKKYDN